ncbi:AraC-type DNA-binding protein [Lishizhenia tianjinensis]|uniref:AraC-type DNA-binding protein n=1 Tax=Lishizhenia tianjinensis TaxID=477690 RepID=A0A1I6XEX9_9FLAO|nr:helix-turn-helix domain-containing protein [Lishizhenia tianjinensis]SFT36849.1 AraC-type DNA-binding protein [Lishizhenia tianjinensis]
MIKTYKHIEDNREDIYFKVVRMSELVDRNKGEKEDPHRHDYYTVLVVNKAKGVHKIDFEAYELSENQIYCVSPGQVHQVIEEESSEGFVLLFSNDFLVQNHIPLRFIEDLNLFRNFGETPPVTLDTLNMMRVNSLCELLIDYQNRSMKFHSEAQSSFLKLILIECNNACELPTHQHTQGIEVGNTLLKNFKKLINQHYKEIHTVNTYAEKMNITADHLNRTIKHLTGKTAKDHLDGRITLAAKRLLYFSTLSLKEIAFELGFNEPAHFSSYFKKIAGQSPSNYRKSMQEK